VLTNFSHSLQRVDLSIKDTSLVFSFVCMILVIACKDKEKKSHPPRARHEFAVFVKKKQSQV